MVKLVILNPSFYLKLAGRGKRGWSGEGRTSSAILVSKDLELGRNICSDSPSVRERMDTMVLLGIELDPIIMPHPGLLHMRR